MQINGEWIEGPDGVERPILRGEVLNWEGEWKRVHFLVDIGADSTVLSANILKALQLSYSHSAQKLGGVGGISDSVIVDAQIRFFQDDGGEVLFRGQFRGLTDSTTLDMSVLGREVLDLFAVIVDRPNNLVCLLRPPHEYTIGVR